MRNFIAQFVGSDPTSEKITCISYTPNLAYQGVCLKLKKKLAEVSEAYTSDMERTGTIPERLNFTQFELDAHAILYGSDDLRPHVTVRSLPPD